MVARALLAQINYTADVAANMPPHTYTTGSGVFRFAWRGQQAPGHIVCWAMDCRLQLTLEAFALEWCLLPRIALLVLQLSHLVYLVPVQCYDCLTLVG